jgi:hypothetical protein
MMGISIGLDSGHELSLDKGNIFIVAKNIGLGMDLYDKPHMHGRVCFIVVFVIVGDLRSRNFEQFLVFVVAPTSGGRI